MHPLELFKFCPKCGSSAFVENNEKSKRCEDCGFVFYFNASAANVAIIVNNKNELLVARRAKEPAKGTLDLPGGFADCGETVEEGVAREVKEETGLSVESTKYLFSIPNIYIYSGMELHTMDMFFLCRVSDCTSLKADDDVAGLKWVAIEKLDSNEFGLLSIKKGVERIKELYKNI